jgi:hypothetical protein
MIYLLVLLFLFVVSVLCKSKNEANFKIYLLAYFILTLIAGLRYNVGYDTINYTEEFRSFPKLSMLNESFILFSNYRILWIYLESIIRTITASFYVFQVLLAMFVNYAVFRFFWGNSTRPFLAILLYYLTFYFNLNMEILRESIPISIMLLSFKLIYERRWTKYFLCSFVASLFHESGFFMFLIPLILRIKIRWEAYLIVIILIAWISLGLYSLILKYIPNVTELLEINQNKLGYFESDFWINNLQTKNTFIVLICRYIILPFIIFFSFFKYLDRIVLNSIFLYILLAILTLYLPIIYRFRDYMFLFVILGFVNGLDIKYILNNTIGSKLFASFCFVVFIFIALFRLYYNPKSSGNQKLYFYYPYTSVFNEQFPEQRKQNLLIY